MKKLIVLLLTLAVLTITPASMANVYIDDGASHTIDDATYENENLKLDYYIVNAPGTHVDLVNGGAARSVTAYNNATVTISGGTVSNKIDSQDNSTITISGGGLGESAGRYYARKNGTIYLEGTIFEVNGQALSYGDKLSDFVPLLDDYYTGTITGTLSDGSTVDRYFSIYNTGSYAGTGDIIVRVPSKKAYCPVPENGAEFVSLYVDLNWKPGELASSTNGHDVYFGTDFNNVQDANVLPDPYHVYQGRQDPNSFNPGIFTGESLDYSTTYYWRIDEVNESDANSPWKGDVWSFTVEPPSNLLTINVDPDDIGINTVLPIQGEHQYYEGYPATVTAGPFSDCPHIWLFDHWDGVVEGPNSASTVAVMDSDKTITAFFIRATPVCGDVCHPIQKGDLNEDCYINMIDFVMYASKWSSCTHPDCD